MYLLDIILSSIMGCLIGFFYSYMILKHQQQQPFSFLKLSIHGTFRIIITAFVFSLLLLHLDTIPFILLSICFIGTVWIMLLYTEFK
jgi:hypothetical protein